MTEHESGANPALRKDWRFYAGLISFVLAWIAPFFALIVPSLGLPSTWAAFLAGSMVVGGPEALGVIAVILAFLDGSRSGFFPPRPATISR